MDQALDVAEERMLVHADQGDRRAFVPRPAGPADPVEVILGHMG
jgi:hypothetical protein